MLRLKNQSGLCGRAARRERGVALLAVLWLSVALTMIAMTTAYLVRTEASAVANHIEAERAGLLAQGAVEAAVYALQHLTSDPTVATDPSSLMRPFRVGQRWLRFEFPDGSAVVEVMPENAKLNINQASQAQLEALFSLLGTPTNQSQELAAAIVDWRALRPSTISTLFDQFYASLAQPYEARHAPIEELEELLAVKGMDRELFFGRLLESPDGTWRRTPPLADLLTTEPALGGVNVTYAAYEVLRVLPGWDESLANEVMAARTRATSGTLLQAVPALSNVASLSPVTVSPGLAYTLTATAVLRDSNVRHSVRARIRLDRQTSMGFQVTGWWEDWPWSPAPDAAWAPRGGTNL